ncbi:hypothetical protein [Catenovulum agarivorans]|uniref:hypothetical protein n=1 Tax=Catenovulum agarivorans TaxID=1172192 RepID=UPI0002DF0557|nr:hypothetical protein [Catenovulum agarivorans]
MDQQAKIAVIGVGGCGCNNVKLLAELGLTQQAKLYALNTDIVSKQQNGISYIQLGENTTKGLGAGAKPEIGEAAANESVEQITKLITDLDLLILTAGLGGGTGSGALPVICNLAAQINLPTICVVTLPFAFEGKKRMHHAQAALHKIEGISNAIQVLANDKLKSTLGAKATLLDCFAYSNQANVDCLSGLVSVLTDTALINLDLNDIKEVLLTPSFANVSKFNLPLDNLTELTDESLVNPLSPYQLIGRCHAALVYIKAPSDFELTDLEKIGSMFQQHISESALIVLGFQQVAGNLKQIEVFYLLNGVLEKDPTGTLLLVSDNVCR